VGKKNLRAKGERRQPPFLEEKRKKGNLVEKRKKGAIQRIGWQFLLSGGGRYFGKSQAG